MRDLSGDVSYVLEYRQELTAEETAFEETLFDSAMTYDTQYGDKEHRFFTLKEAFGFIQAESHRIDGDVSIARCIYCPGFYRDTDWEPWDSWSVDPDKVKTVCNLWPRKAAA
jgi:hypothetical protein